jgi:hypothetical protein
MQADGAGVAQWPSTVTLQFAPVRDRHHTNQIRELL